MTVSRIPTDAPHRLHPCVPVADELAALDAESDDFEAEFHDGPPVAGVLLLLAAFMAGLFLGGWLAWLM